MRNSLPKRGKGAKQGRLFAVGIQKSVDESFLDDLDSYRAELARAFKNKNPELDGEDLTEAVTRTIDRLVFIQVSGRQIDRAGNDDGQIRFVG